jgi:lambda family phage portal protein
VRLRRALNFYGLQRLAMETIAEAGEVLIVKQPASTSDGLAIPMRLQVLEPDYLDTNRNGLAAISGGPIIDGVEFDKQGRRVAYWLFTSHPGGQRLMTTRFESVRVPAERVLHIYRVDRPGQVRGVPWLASAITRLKDLDDFEDAELMQQKVAACFGAFVTDIEGAATPIGGPSSTDSDGIRSSSSSRATSRTCRPAGRDRVRDAAERAGAERSARARCAGSRSASA